MGFKNLFINDEGDKKPEVKEAPKQMPSSIPGNMPTSIPVVMPTEMPKEVAPAYQSPSELDKVLTSVQETYLNGFNTLNREGYDFFEYYQSIKAINGTTPDSYKMAFTLGKMNGNITPESLVNDSLYYVTEIDKVYTQFENAGRNKASELEGLKSQKKTGLVEIIESKKAEIDRLQRELETRTAELNNIDSEFSEQLDEITLKLQANNIARNNLVSSIQEVANNIKNYLN